jgi:DNA primase
MKRVSQETIEKVLNDVNILDVISPYVSLKARGRNYFGLSPFRTETKPSFSVSPDKNMWYDFGSGQGGNAIQFIIEFEKISFGEAVKLICEKHGIEFIETGATEDNNVYDSLYEIHELACLFFQSSLHKKEVEDYLKSRSITQSIIKKFRIGYASDSWDDMLNEFKGKFEESILLESGLFSKGKNGLVNRFRNRIMFPFFNLSGKVIGFSGRSISEKEDVKYLNSPETRLFQKSKVFFGSYLTFPNIRKNQFAILVEGQTDFLRLFSEGYHNVLATSGTAFSLKHASALKKFTNRVLLAYDSDSAGINAAIRTSYVLLQSGMEVRIIDMKEGLDPDEFFIKEKAPNEAFKALIKNALHPVDYLVLKKKALEGGASDQSRFLDEQLLEVIQIKDPIIVNDLIKRFATKFQIDEGEILKRIEKIKPNQFTERSISGEASQDNPNIILSDTLLERAEIELLKILIQNSSMKDKISISDFSNQYIKEIATKILEDSQEISISSLLDSFGSSPKLRNFLASLIIDYSEKDDLNLIVEDCLRVIYAEPTRQKIQLLRSQIQQLEDNGQQPSTDLLKELAELQKNLKK